MAPGYKDVVLFLATAGVAAPLVQRLKISPVLGFLGAGAILGPYGLGSLADRFPWLELVTISDADQFRLLGELGVVFLLFSIGLELSWERLRRMRRLVFGLGFLQVAICALGIGFAAWLLGRGAGVGIGGAAAIGAALALSSTAIVTPVLAETKRLGSAPGRATFSVLLAQDLAVAPLLFAVSFLAGSAAGSTGAQAAVRFGLTLAPAILAVGLLVVIGRLLLRPMMQSVARADSRELFFAASLLIVIGAGLISQVAGLSMALGAFVAGLLLAETEFRREVEVTIEPFRGLLLGLFFVSVGIGLDIGQVLANPLLIVGGALAFFAFKTAVVFGLGLVYGLTRRQALETALVLGPAGEFAFVILGEAMTDGLVPAVVGQGLLVSATLSMFIIPLLAKFGRRLTRRREAEPLAEPEAMALDEAPQVIIAGYGRVGRLVANLLKSHDVPFLAIESDAAVVAEQRRDGEPINFGDAARAEFLRRCGLMEARAIVVTMDAPSKVDEVVKAARALRSDLIVIARARDARHAAKLYQLGATDAVPETVEASLQLAENTLVDLGVPMGLVIASIHEKREEYRRMLQESVPEGRPPRAIRPSARSRAVAQG
jgi:CPA2 family monovalent cation:H+ antiporter-2